MISVKAISQISGLLLPQEKKQGFVLVVGMLLVSGWDVVSLGLLAIYTSVLTGSSPDSYAQTFITKYLGSGLSSVIVLSFCLIAVFAVKILLVAAIAWLSEGLDQRLRVRIASRLYEKYLNESWEYHLKHNSAELLRNLTVEVNRLSTYVIGPLLTFVFSLISTLSVFTFVILYVDGEILLPVIPVSLVLFFWLKFTREKLARFGITVHEQSKRMVQVIKEGLASFREIKVLGATEILVKKHFYHISSMSRAQRNVNVINRLTAPITETSIMLGLVCVVGLLLVMDREIVSVGGVFVVMAAACLRLKSSMTSLVMSSSNLKHGQVTLECLVRELSVDEETKSGSVAVSSVSQDWRQVTLRDVGFRYSGSEKSVLKNVDLVINRGQRIAITGPSGSGKTTLGAIILGLLQPSSGSVEVDDISLSAAAVSWWELAAYVPQFPFMLDDTIQENVVFGGNVCLADEVRLRQALGLSQLDCDLGNIQNGLQTCVGESGARISGGQRQRVGLARAFYRESKLVVLDEPTSALDSDTSRRFLSCLEKAPKDITFVLITHSSQVSSACDVTYEISDGDLRKVD